MKTLKKERKKPAPHYWRSLARRRETKYFLHCTSVVAILLVSFALLQSMFGKLWLRQVSFISLQYSNIFPGYSLLKRGLRYPELLPSTNL